MLTQDNQAARNQALDQGTEGNDLSGKALPTSGRSEARTSVLSRVAAVAALSAALATNGVPAQAQTNALTDPNPNVEPAVPEAPQAAAPAAAPAPAPAMDITKSNITRLEKRPFCMTDEGKVLLVTDRESQVRRPGSFVEGSPSTGTALQALAYAKEHLEQMHDGKIPDGYKAVLYIRSAGVANSAELNLNAIPAVKDLGPIAHGMAKNDPLTGQAIEMIHNGVNINVLNDGGTFTMTFKNKFGDVPLLMTVELEKR